MELKPPKGFVDKLKFLPKLADIAKFPPVEVSKGACQEVVEKDPDLSTLPVLKCWPQDGGRFITLPLVYTQDPETGVRNIGMYRIQIYDKQTTGMHWQVHHHGAGHHRKAEKMGKRLEVAVALGGRSSPDLRGHRSLARRHRRIVILPGSSGKSRWNW